MAGYNAPRRRAEIVQTKPVYGKGTTKGGNRPHVGTKCIDADGVVSVLLTPAGKTAKAAEELRRNTHLTNDGKVKTDKKGNPMRLTQAEASYRMGQLAQAKASANCYKAQKKFGGRNK